MSKYVCPNCGNDRFQEVGSVATVTDVILEADYGDIPEDLSPDEIAEQVEKVKPTFVDYSAAGSQTVWDASDSYFIECSTCLAEIEAEGFESRRPDDEALDRIRRVLDGREWSADELPIIAEILRQAGKPVRPPGEVD